MQVLIYVLYCFMLYTVYCFGMAAKCGEKNVVLSTASTLRVLFYIKSSLLVISAYLSQQFITNYQLLLYCSDTLLIFIFTLYVREFMNNDILVMRRKTSGTK